MSTFSFEPNKNVGSPFLSSTQSSAQRLELLRASKAKRSGSMGSLLNLKLSVLVGLGVLFCICVFNLSDISGADKEKINVDATVLLKIGFLGIAGLYGVIGAYTDSKVRRLMFSFPVVWIWLLFGFYCLGVVKSVTPKESVASAISIACVLLCTSRVLVQHGVESVLRTVLYALSAFVLISWLLFLFVPEIGVFEEDTVEGQIFKRMGGLAHPNTLGQFSGLNIVLGLLFFRNYGLKMNKWRWLVIALAAGALIASVSRTSLIATVFALVFVYRDKCLRREYLPYIFGLGIVGLMGLLALSATTDLGSAIESKLAVVSKSGDAEELTTATGRAEIWAYSIKLIVQQPVFGYGAATSKWFLSDYSLYTHNLVLNVAFSTGVFGGLACLMMVLGRVSSVIYRPHRIADALLVFILVNGMFENVIFSILCGLPTIVWIIAMAIPVMDNIAEEDSEPRLGMEASQ